VPPITPTPSIAAACWASFVFAIAVTLPYIGPNPLASTINDYLVTFIAAG
jgi:hypothetical protein